MIIFSEEGRALNTARTFRISGYLEAVDLARVGVEGLQLVGEAPLVLLLAQVPHHGDRVTTHLPVQQHSHQVRASGSFWTGSDFSKCPDTFPRSDPGRLTIFKA